MNTSFIEEIKSSVKNWWISLILGILFIGTALLLMFNPLESYGALVILFSICMFASGILEIAFSVSNKNVLSGWGWYLTSGIIDLLLGIFLVCYPGVTAVVLPFIIAFWIMFRGFAAIGFSIDLSRVGVKGWGWYLVFGILAILCSIAIIWQPAAGALASVYIVAFAFMFMGFFRIMLAFELRDLYKNSQELKDRLNSLQERIK
ncbi:MAG: DUF308 domain-containing protein [Tannerella sp.]|jgi:uncharacterized membrane protein HdeD (DUF308 family)|nr:DUF308 domain-containing protein [Tannerella sp.]